MPELPEVETIVRALRPALLGRCIKSVRLNWPGSIATPAPASFKKQVIGKIIKDLSRRGKFLHFTLSSGEFEKHLFVHLRMSGRLELQPPAAARGKHDRVVFELDKRQFLRFSDTRKFGRMYLLADPGKFTEKLGPEPLRAGLRAKAFFESLAAHSAAIKPLLLNQSFLAGVGNIYADESLWRAKLHPRRKSDSLSLPEAAGLLSAIRQTLRQALNFKGTDAGDGVVEFGNYRTRVYGRQGKKCPRCSAEIVRIVVAQRGTHICPRCQGRSPRKVRVFQS